MTVRVVRDGGLFCIKARLAGRRVSNTSVFILVPVVLLIVILAYSCRHQADFAVA